MRVLLIAEASPESAEIVRKFATRSQAIDLFASIDEGAAAISACDYDVAIIDLETKDLLKPNTVREIRSSGSTTPLIALSPIDCVKKRIECLNHGADDCLAKPFDYEELMARVWALSRRKYGLIYDVVEFGGLSFDRRHKTASLYGNRLPLTQMELSTLEVLIAHVGKPVHKECIYHKLYGLNRAEVGINAVETLVSRIRKKISHANLKIETIRDFGYCVAEVDKHS